MASFRVVVVGGGVTGLVAARQLRKDGVAVTLVEATFPFGGRVRTQAVDIPGFGRAAFDLGSLFLPPPHTGHDPTSPAGLPPRSLRYHEFGTRPDWLGSVQVADQHPNSQTVLHASDPRPTRDGMQEVVNRLLPTGPDDNFDVRTLTEVTALEPSGEGWRVRTRVRSADGGEWSVGDSVGADAVVLTQPVPDALALLDASRVALPDGLRDELAAVRYEPRFALLAAYPGPTRMLAPVMRFFDGSALAALADNHATGTSPTGAALTAVATGEWSAGRWELSDEAVTEQLLAAVGLWVTGSPVWTRLHRWPRAVPRGRIRLPFAQLTTPPLFLAGDSFAEYAGLPLDSAYTSGLYVARRVCRLLTDIRRRRGGRTVGTRLSLEVAVTSEYDARQAASNGADRLLVCSALELGGLTPSEDVLARVTEAAVGRGFRRLPVAVMIRPRPGGFDYDASEFRLMLAQARRGLELGADGLAFGVLHTPGGRGGVRIDFARCRELVELCHAAGKEAVFHRAFDLLPDRRSGLHELIQLGVNRVVTSGGKRDALDGIGQLEADVQFGGWDIVVAAAGRLTADTIGAVVRGTGCDDVLGSFRRVVRDATLPGNSQLAASFGAADGGYLVTDGTRVGAAAECLLRLTADARTAEGE